MADVTGDSDELMRLLTAGKSPHAVRGQRDCGLRRHDVRALPMLNLEEKITEDSDKRRRTPRPVGAVGGIAPWNSPSL
jgi:acyl-CoA reductase-like NAD-dependent aldehyde dehydrogenase